MGQTRKKGGSRSKTKRSKRHTIPHNPVRSLGLIAFASLRGKGPKLRPKIKPPTPPHIIRPPNTYNHLVPVEKTVANISPIKWGGSKKTKKIKRAYRHKKAAALVVAALASGNAPTPPPKVAPKTPPYGIRPPTNQVYAVNVTPMAPIPGTPWQRR